jgi:AcrR family transcriptional regulator
VYRYFQDRDELVRAVIAHKQLKVLPMFHIKDIGNGELSSRISRLVDSRLGVYDAIGATARAMTIKASSDPVIGEQVKFRKSIFREQIEVNFAQEFARMTPAQRANSLNAIDALGQVESLDRFRIDLELSSDRTRELLIGSIEALLNIGL